MSFVGVELGVWLFRKGEVILGSAFIALWLWNEHRFALWLTVPRTPAVTQPLGSFWERLSLTIACFLAAGICGVGAYFWRLWPEQWQAGFVFILFGLIVLIPVTIREIQLRCGTLRA